MDVDMIIVSPTPKRYRAQLAGVFNIPQYIIDASNTMWKIDQWQKECNSLHLNFFTIPAEGAFVYETGM
jgi:competence protein ComEC